MVYLREPVKEKELEDGGAHTSMPFGVCSMQGWRRSMEDAHLAVPDLDEGVGLFGVFDGHGGKGVSRFAARRLPEILKSTEEYKAGDYVKALERAFLAVDEHLRTAEGRKAVEELDRDDGGRKQPPVAVPKRILARFLGNKEEEGSGPPSDGEPEPAPSTEAEPAAEAEGTTKSAEAEAERKPPATPPPSPSVRKQEEEAAEAASGDGEPTIEGEGDPAAAGEAAGREADAEGEGEEEELVLDPDEDLGDFGGLMEDDDDEWDVAEEGEEMALVDPSNVMRDTSPEAQGCTAVVVLVVGAQDGRPAKLYCANAGDSRAVMSRKGTVVALSEDHKPENDEETARITKAGGFVQNMPGGARVQGDLNLSRAMGDLRYKKPDHLPPQEQILTAFPEVRSFERAVEDEFMVLGCDGIWERTGNQEIVDFIHGQIKSSAASSSLSSICGAICDKGLCPDMDPASEHFDGTGCDNMTVMIVQLHKELLKRPAGAAEGETAAKRAKTGAEAEAGPSSS